MRLPKLNRRLVLEGPLGVPDGAGGFAQSWVPLGTHWADVRIRSGRERTRSTGTVSALELHIIVRAAPVGSPQRPVAEQRFREGDRFYAITAVADYDEAGQYLKCISEEERAT